MTNDEAAWEVQYLVNRKAELDQGRETLAAAGVLLFDSDGISHGIEQLIERHTKVSTAAQNLLSALATERAAESTYHRSGDDAANWPEYEDAAATVVIRENELRATLTAA